MLDFAYIALSSTLVPVLRVRGHYGYTDLKNQVFLVLSFLHLAAVLLWEGRLPFPSGPAATALCAYLLLLTFSCAWSDNAEDSIRDLPRWWTLFYFFLVCQRVDLVLAVEAVFLPAPFVATYGLVQQWLGIEPFWQPVREVLKARKKATRLYSWLGNSNYTAAYLVPCFFAGCYLAASTSLWWIAGLVPVWLAIGWSQCRAAWLATIFGLVVADMIFLWHPLLMLLGLVALLAVAMISIQRIEPTIGRYYYIRTCIRLFKRAPLFGWGPRVFRRQYFEEQARMNEADPEILGTIRKPGKNTFPIGKRAHCDHFETLAESGLLGYALFAMFYVSVISGASDVLLLAGVVAGLTNALFFYSLRTGATALPFFALCGVLSPASSTLAIPLAYSLVILPLLGYLVYRLGWIPYRAGLYFWDAQGSEDKATARRLLDRALRLEPNNNMYLSLCSILHMPEDPAGALLAIIRCLHQNDGQKVGWAVLDQLGRLAYMNSAFFLAHQTFRAAIRLNPSSPMAYEGLKVSAARLREIEQVLQKAAAKQTKKN